MSLNKRHTSTTTVRVDAWDGWRGTAIVLVLCGHFYDIDWLWEDRLGVDIFFVLSGMLMSKILFELRISLKDFYIRRLSRVIPVLFSYIVVAYSIAWVQNIEFSTTELTSSLLFLRTYIPSEPGIWDTDISIGHLWSLNVEEHAYVILSIISTMYFCRNKIIYILLVFVLTSILISFYFYFTSPIDNFRITLIRTESAIVFIFCSAAYALLKNKYNLQGHPIVTCICILGSSICYIEQLPDWLIFLVSPLLLSIAVNHMDNLNNYLKIIYTNTVIRYIGIYSYSIYIWQQLLFDYAWAFPYHKSFNALLAILIGALSYKYLENPVRHYINVKWSSYPKYRDQDIT